VKLIRLTLTNFMPYKGETILDFPQDPDRNTLIVLGDNMRGKTSLLNGIRWAFYQKAQGRHLRSIPLHLMPNRDAITEGDWTMEARIEFEAEGVYYDLRREAKKRSTVSRPERPEDYQVFAFMKKDGAAVAANEIEAEINRFAPEQVSRFFLFDGELLQEYEELLVEGSEQGKKIKEAIEQALGVPALINGRDDLQALWKRAQKEQGKEASLVAGLEAVAESFSKWSARRDMFDADLVTLKTQQAAVREERRSLEDLIAQSESVYAHKIELDAKRERLKQIFSGIDSKEGFKRGLAADAWRDLVRPRLLEKRDQLQGRLAGASKLAGQQGKLQYQIEHLREHLGDSVCPTCGQKVENVDRAAQQRQLDDLLCQRAALASGDVNSEDIATRHRAVEKVLSTSVRARVRDADSDLSNLEVESARVESRIDELDEELLGQDPDSVVRMRQRLKAVERDEAKGQIEIEDREKKLGEADREIQSLTQRMNARAGQNSTKAALMSKMFGALHGAFDASIDQLRTNLRATVEKNATDAFLRMSTQKSYRGLSINANYGLTILGPDGESVPLRSAGAEQVVALSLIDGLSRANRAPGPVVMDTPFGRLDTKHRQNILSYLPDSARQFVLFVHDGELGEGAALDSLAHRIGGKYEIQEVSPNQSRLRRMS
jgi:DNA sulfur modification protein DndD